MLLDQVPLKRRVDCFGTGKACFASRLWSVDINGSNRVTDEGFLKWPISKCFAMLAQALQVTTRK